MAKDTSATKSKSASESRGLPIALLEVPFAALPGSGYELQVANAGKTHLNVHIGKEAASAFLQIRNGLRDTNAKLSNGRPVHSNADAFRFLMEQLAVSIEENTTR